MHNCGTPHMRKTHRWEVSAHNMALPSEGVVRQCIGANKCVLIATCQLTKPRHRLILLNALGRSWLF